MTETLRENGGSWAEELAEAPARQRKSRPSKASNSRGSTPGGTPRSRKAQAAGEGFRHALEAQLRAQQNHAGNSAKASLLHRYQITPNILGEGATGKVKAAVHRETGQKVAIKTFRWNKLCESAKADVLRESGIQCSLDHPKIAKAREMVKTGERLYLVLEMLEGGDVLDRLHEAEHLTERLAMRVVKQVLEAIQYMHSNGMVHRDIKPDNIVFESVDRDQVKLIDFGLCCEWHEGMAPMMRRCGTEFYMAPEVHEGSYTNKVDIWSLGAAAHAMLTGQVIGRRRDGSASFGPLLSRCSPQCQHFVEALLAKDPERRPTAKQALDHPWLEESDKFLKLMGNEIGSSRPTTLTNSHLNMRHVSSMSSCSYFTPPFAANVSGCSPTESLRSLPCGSSRAPLRLGLLGGRLGGAPRQRDPPLGGGEEQQEQLAQPRRRDASDAEGLLHARGGLPEPLRHAADDAEGLQRGHEVLVGLAAGGPRGLPLLLHGGLRVGGPGRILEAHARAEVPEVDLQADEGEESGSHQGVLGRTEHRAECQRWV